MSRKKVKLVCPSEVLPGPSREEAKTDWNLCVICQAEGKNEKLQCPADSNRQPVGAGYVTFSENIEYLAGLDELPADFNPNRLDEGDGVTSTLLLRRAKWHKSCQVKFSSDKVKRAQKKKLSECDENETARKHTRLSGGTTDNKHLCIFCEESTSESLRQACTFQLDQRVRECATELQDMKLISKLSEGDMVAIEAKYHARCLANLYYRAKLQNNNDGVQSSDKLSHGIALAELLSYMEDIRRDSAFAAMFKLADLTTLYESRLKYLMNTSTERVHSTRLKERILSHFPDMTTAKDGRHIYLTFNENMGSVMSSSCLEDDGDDEALILAKAAKIVRKHMFDQNQNFTGTFTTNCQMDSIPQSLLALVNMILYSPNIEHQQNTKQAAMSLAQLLHFNSVKRPKKDQSGSSYHSRNRETPLPVFVALTIHGKTRKRELVDTMCELGLSVSYDRVSDIITSTANRCCQLYSQTGVACSPNLRKSLFTTAAIDNIDHNTSSSTAKDSFHGTGISLFQNLLSVNDGDTILFENDDASKRQQLQPLPSFYTEIKPRSLPKTFQVPAVTISVQSSPDRLNEAKKVEEM